MLIAANGITGNSQRIEAAHEIIRVALSEGRQLIVITRAEIENLRVTEELMVMITQIGSKSDAEVGTIWWNRD